MSHSYCYSCNSSFDVERKSCPDCKCDLQHFFTEAKPKSDTETIIEQNARIITLLKLIATHTHASCKMAATKADADLTEVERHILQREIKTFSDKVLEI